MMSSLLILNSESFALSGSYKAGDAFIIPDKANMTSRDNSPVGATENNLWKLPFNKNKSIKITAMEELL